MNRYYSLAIFLISFSFSYSSLAQNYSEMSKILEKIEIEDHKIREEIAALQAIKADTSLINEKFKIANEINIGHRKYVEELLTKYGWQPPDSISKDASIAIVLAIQHSGPDFMKFIFPKVEEAKNKGYLPLYNYALIIDRIRVFSDDYQLYGTQAKSINGGVSRFFPILEEHKVDKRRKEMGLSPISEYAESLHVDYQKPKRKVNKRLYCFYGNIHDEKNNPLSEVKLYDGRYKYLTQTDKNGFFTIYLKKKNVNQAFIYEKAGYYRWSIVLKDFDYKVHSYDLTMYEISSEKP